MMVRLISKCALSVQLDHVRTLAEDFGKRLGLGAHLAELRRARAGDFGVQNATTLEQLKPHLAEESLGKSCMLPDDASRVFLLWIWATTICGRGPNRHAGRRWQH